MVTLVVSVDKEGIIGPIKWKCPMDLRHFRSLSWGANCIVGRRTWVDLPSIVRKCEGRRWYVVSHKSKVDCSGWEMCLDWVEVEGLMRNNDPYCQGRHWVIVGGASIYRQALEEGLVDRAFITRLPVRHGGDVEWPGLPEGWEKVRSREELCSIYRLDEDGNRFNHMYDQVDPEGVTFEEWIPGEGDGD